MKKIGVFGGAFDPIHFGHLNLAISLYEAHHLDAVWWIPTQVNPLKQSHAVSAQHRLNMLSLALENIPMFKVLDIEVKRPGVSFTVDTLNSLHQEYPEVELHLLLGDDLVMQFHLWKNPLKIIELASPYVGARHTNQRPFISPEASLIEKSLISGWTSIPLIEISATNIRKRLKEKRFCGHLLPVKVLDYILMYGLYSSHEKI